MYFFLPFRQTSFHRWQNVVHLEPSPHAPPPTFQLKTNDIPLLPNLERCSPCYHVLVFGGGSQFFPLDERYSLPFVFTTLLEALRPRCIANLLFLFPQTSSDTGLRIPPFPCDFSVTERSRFLSYSFPSEGWIRSPTGTVVKRIPVSPALAQLSRRRSFSFEAFFQRHKSPAVFATPYQHFPPPPPVHALLFSRMCPFGEGRRGLSLTA